jgi:hypothetical protein
MKKPFTLLLLVSLLSPLTFANTTTKIDSPLSESTLIKYPSGGYSTVIIHRPISEVFNTLTNVTEWPNINKGVTQAITPANVNVKKGAKFKETIASPIPGVPNWTKELTVEEYVPNKLFVISGVDTFAAKAPIFARLKYEFVENSKDSTIFTRSIEVDLSDNSFLKNANKQEVESLYRFLGSQSEMANHLKKYVEENSPSK